MKSKKNLILPEQIVLDLMALTSRLGEIAVDYNNKIGGKETRFIGGDFNQMTSGSYTSICLNDTYISSSTNMSLKTTTGIVAIGAGSNIDVRSSATTLIKSGTTYTETVGTTRTSTTGSTWSHTSGGDITITGGPNINLNP